MKLPYSECWIAYHAFEYDNIQWHLHRSDITFTHDLVTELNLVAKFELSTEFREVSKENMQYLWHDHRGRCLQSLYLNFYISILSYPHPSSYILHPASYIKFYPTISYPIQIISSYPTKIFQILVETKIRCSPTLTLYISLVIYATKR